MTYDSQALLRRRGVLTAIAALAMAPAAQARSPVPSPLVQLEVIDRDTGQAAGVWRRHGRQFVAGRPGARYSLRVTNNTSGRLLVVMSVDGVNILTGETAGVDQRGYVLSPYASQDITGWRKSDSQVAAFTFAPLHRSYAARTGRPDDVGVIGVAAFTERVRYAAPQVTAPAYESRADGAAAAPPPQALARAAPQPEKLGTGHGAREWSPVTTVRFERASTQPQFVTRLEYDSHENLVSAGVIPRPRPRPVPSNPRPFPSNPGYVPDPPLYR